MGTASSSGRRRASVQDIPDDDANDDDSGVIEDMLAHDFLDRRRDSAHGSQ